MAVPLPGRAVAKAAEPGGGGYWLTDPDGEVYAFEQPASSYGSLTNMHLNSPVVGIASAPDGKGTGWSPGTAACSPSAPPSSTGPCPP